MSINNWHPHCPYLSSIGENEVQCTLHCKMRNEQHFDNNSDVDEFTDKICFLDFDTCLVYQKIYTEEMASNDEYILDYRKCAFCCNSSGFTGLKIHHGGTHCYCQRHGIEVEKFNSNTACDWFNKKASAYEVNDMFDMLKMLSGVEYSCAKI